MVRREELERREFSILAPYAMKSAESEGRRFDEPTARYRTSYQRDRDRIIHCKAFRRLEYKTQVFLNHEGDHYRTRLTHTMEVTQISRTLARALGLNEDLAEAIALAHDVGHTPFGHTGEEALRQLMSEHGGFEHNRHGLRVVDLLETQYPDFPGLNLSREVRESIVKHHTRWDRPESDEFGDSQPLLEAQAVAVSDSIAYDNHDLQDGLEAGILQPEALMELELVREATGAVTRRRGELPETMLFRCAVGYLIDRFVTDAVSFSSRRIQEAGVGSWQEAKESDAALISFSPELSEPKSSLEDFLHDTLYRDYRVVRVTNSVTRFVNRLFHAYVDDPRQLPPQQQAWAREIGLHRAVCDYIAGMTDRYAQDQYIQLFEPYQKL